MTTSAHTPMSTDRDLQEVGGAPSSMRQAAVLGLSGVVAIAVALLLAPSMVVLAGSYSRASILQHFVLLPLFTLSACWMLLAPGVLLVAARARSIGIPALTLLGSGVSLALFIAGTSVAKLAGAIPFERPALAAVAVLLLAATTAVYARAAGKGTARRFSRDDLVPSVALAVIIPLVVCFLLPELFWQELDGDGFEALEMGWVLRWTIIPRFSTASGFLGLGTGMVTMAWSNHWWVALLGPVPAAARLPLAFNVVALAAGLAALAESGAARRLLAREWAALLLGLAGVVAVFAFDASYSPHFTDLASPAAVDTLPIVLMCGVLYALWNRQAGMLALFALLGALARPTVPLVGLFGALALFLADRSRRAQAARGAAIIVGMAVIAYIGYERIAAPLLRETRGMGYAAGTLLERIQYLRLFEVRRLAWIALPAGIVPWLSVLAWRRLDTEGRVLCMVLLAYTAFVFPIAFTNLHQFIPAMVFPLALFWRLALQRQPGWVMPGVAAAGAILSLVVAVPPQRPMQHRLRDVGASVDVRIGSLDPSYVEHRKALRSAPALQAIFRLPWRIPDLQREKSGGLQLLYYASRPKLPGQRINYVVQPDAAAPPPGMIALARGDGWATWAADSAQLIADRTGNFDVHWRRRPYDIGFETMIAEVGARAHAYDIDLRAAASRLLRRGKG